MAVQHHKTPAIIYVILSPSTASSASPPYGLSFHSPCLREVMKLALAIMCGEDYYECFYSCQTEQETDRKKASKNNGKSICKSFVNRL